MLDIMRTVSTWSDPNTETTFGAAARRAVWQTRPTAVYGHLPLVSSGTPASQARESARVTMRGRVAGGPAGSTRAAHASRIGSEWEQALNDALTLAGQ
jgi:hypothetical protein